jgi:hypothetical protein
MLAEINGAAAGCGVLSCLLLPQSSAQPSPACRPSHAATNGNDRGAKASKFVGATLYVSVREMEASTTASPKQ